MESINYTPTKHPSTPDTIKSAYECKDKIISLFEMNGANINGVDDHSKSGHFNSAYFNHDRGYFTPNTSKFYAPLNKMGFQVSYISSGKMLIAPLCDLSKHYR